MPKNACDEPVVLTEPEQLAMQKLFEYLEDYEAGWGQGEGPWSELDMTEAEYDAMRAKFF